jgi:puromycin-sensitive aminopeptidase
VTETAADRLPRTIRPIRYHLRLEVDIAGAAFHGEARIDVEVLEPTSTIECHALDLVIGDVAVEGTEVAGHRLDPGHQRLRIDVAAPLEPGTHTVTVGFSAELNDKLVGFYRSTYDDDAGRHTLAITQFEAPFARRCFPCWDEPDRKATFDVTLVVDDGLLAISNAAEVAREPAGEGRVAVRFAETMPMSTYLVAFVVGRLEASTAVDVEGTPVRVVHRPGQGHLVDTALDVAAHSLRWFGDYYGIPYPGDKLDLVAVPDFAFGAMENLGCVTFREVLLLLDPEKLTQPEIERAALVIAHELAHMWFGDLVTMDWWDGIWLNEAFATFMELACVDAYRPDWGVWRTFGLSKAQAYDTDALASTRAIHYEVRTPEEAEGMFDILTYEKGAAVLRMVEQYLGPDTFRAGIRRYLAAHSYGNTHMSDLWAALDAVTDADVSALMDSWILHGGHPVVEVGATDRGASLHQRRMSFAGGDPVEDRRYVVPVHVRAGVGGEVVEARGLLDGDALDLDLGGRPEWMCANVDGTGFYRSAYGPVLRAGLVDAPERLADVERFCLVDDAWALVLADALDLADLATLLRSHRPDEDPSVWRRAAGIVATLAQLAGTDGTAAAAVSTFAQDLAMRALMGTTDAERRGILLRIAGGPGRSAAAIAEARQLLEAGGAADPELQAAAVDVVASNGDAADFDRFVAGYRNAPTPQEVLRYLGALTRFRDAELFERLLAMCVDEVRTQNAPYTLAQAMGNPANGPLAWRLVRDRWDELTARFPSNSHVRMVSGVRSLFEPKTAADVLDFFTTHQLPQGAKTLAHHLEVVRVHQALRDRLLDALPASLATP